MVFMTNAEVIEYLGLPNSVITDLQTLQGQDFVKTSNQFLQALVNKILYQTVDFFRWIDPFRQFDSFPVNYGDTIENIYLEAPNGYTFNKDAVDPFTKYIPDSKATYASINYEMQYPLTIEDALLRRAALNEYGFMNIINSLFGSMESKKNMDTYLATLSMLNNEELYAGGIGELNLISSDTDFDNAKKLTTQIINDVSSFKLPSTSNNKLGVLTASNPEDILLIIRRDLYNYINLDFLSGVYNLDKVDLIKRIMVVESFKVKDADGEDNGVDIGYIVLDTKALDMHTALEDGGMIYNPKGKYTNHFLNLWKIISFKLYYNAKAYYVTQE